MKKFLTFFLMILVISSLTACGKTKTVSLYDRGLEIVALMEEMAKSEEYLAVFTANYEIEEVIEEIAKGDYSSPTAVYEIEVPLECIDSLYNEIVSSEAMSDGLKQVIERRMRGAFITQINALGGSKELAASSILIAGKQFVSSELTEDTIYLYVYENTAPVAVSYTLDEDHVVYGSGNFLTYEELAKGSKEEIISFFENMGATVTDIIKE